MYMYTVHYELRYTIKYTYIYMSFMYYLHLLQQRNHPAGFPENQEHFQELGAESWTMLHFDEVHTVIFSM